MIGRRARTFIPCSSEREPSSASAGNASGSRSRSATAQLRRAGLDAVNLKGGMIGWSRAGLPLEPRNGRIA